MKLQVTGIWQGVLEEWAKTSRPCRAVAIKSIAAVGVQVNLTTALSHRVSRFSMLRLRRFMDP
jgi:hypothetical protein